MAGIQQTEDVVKALGVVAAAIHRAAKDGLDWKDVSVLLQPGIRDAVIDAVKGSSEIPGEVADLDIQEIMQLFGDVMDDVHKVMDDGDDAA